MTSSLERALPFFFVLACGGTSAPQRTPEVRPAPSDAGAEVATDAAIEAGPPKIDLVVARHDRVAPGMREIARGDLDLAREHELAIAAFQSDTCLRAAFDADAKTAITLVDSHGLVVQASDGTSGAIGAAGPVCFKKGDAATFRFEGQSRLRIVVWASP